jgi:glycosyltransferase involved in cell wall biosynthesis
MSAPPISVVMPVHNGEDFLDQAIDSIRGQTYRDFEVIVVDDGSTDRTAEILRRHAAEDGRLRVVTQQHAGVATALNRGLEVASGPYIARMDADDIAAPNRLGRQLELLSQHSSAAALGSSYTVIDRAGHVLRTVHMPTTSASIREALQRTNCMAHPTVLMRRDAVMAVGGYRHACLLCEDYDLWLRLDEQHDLLNVDEPLLMYREHPGQVTWLHLEQRIFSELAARISARHRRAGKLDPLVRGKPATRSFLHDQGMGDADIRSEIVRRALDAAREASRAGHRKAAWAAFALARKQQRLRWPVMLGFCLALLGVSTASRI